MEYFISRFHHDRLGTLLAGGLVFACLGAFSPAWAGEDRARAEALALEGMAFFEQDPEKGVNLLEDAHGACPEHWAVAYNLGLAYYRAGRPGPAYGQWKALCARGTNSRLLANLGWLALELGKNDEAGVWLEKRKKAGKPGANMRSLAMEVLFAQRRYEEALDISFSHIRFVTYAYRKKAVEYATEDMWNLFRSGRRGDAADRAADLAERFPEVESLEEVRDTMVAALLDENVAIPEPRTLPYLETGGDKTGEIIHDE